MPIRVFPPHYQLVYISFDISSFSVISYILKQALLQCKTAVFANYLDYIDVEIVCKIRRKTLILPYKQAVFVAQYYPISVQQVVSQRLKVARKKSENLQKLLLWCRKVPVISEPRLGRLIIQSLI